MGSQSRTGETGGPGGCQVSALTTFPLTLAPWPGQQSPCMWPPCTGSQCEKPPSPRKEILQGPLHLPYPPDVCLGGGWICGLLQVPEVWILLFSCPKRPQKGELLTPSGV